MRSDLRLGIADAYCVNSLMADVREIDDEEWWVGLGKPTLPSLLVAVEETFLPRAVVDQADRCLAIWGMDRPDSASCAQAWFIATNRAVTLSRAMHRFYKDGIAEMHEHADCLYAYSYEKNHVHHEWMQHFGWRRWRPRTSTWTLPSRCLLFTHSSTRH